MSLDQAAVDAVYATNPTQLGKYEPEPDNVITIGGSAVQGLAANATYAILSDGDGTFTAYAGTWSSDNGGTFTEATGTSGDVSLDQAAVDAVYATNPTQLGKYEPEPDNVITIGGSAVQGLAANATYAILSDGDGTFTAYAGTWSCGTFTEATGTSGDVSLANQAAVDAVYATNPTQLGKYEPEPDNVITIGGSAVQGLAANATYAILSDGDGTFTAYAGTWSSDNGGTFTEATGTSGDVSLANQAAVDAVYATNPYQLGTYEPEPDNVIMIGSSAVSGLAANATYAILSDGDGTFTAYAGTWSSDNGGTFTEATGTSGDVSLDQAAVDAVYATNPTQLGKYEPEPDNVITIGGSAVQGLAANATYAILSDGDGTFTAYAGTWSSDNGGTFTEATGTSGDVSLDQAAVDAVYATNPTQLGKYEPEPDNVITIGGSAVQGLAANATYAILSDGDGTFTAYAGTWSSDNGGTFTEATGTSGDVSLDQAAVDAVYATNPTQLGKYEPEPDNVITIGGSAVQGLAANATYAILSDGDGTFTAYAGTWSSDNGGTFTEATGTSGDVSLDQAAVDAVYATNPTQLGKYEPPKVISVSVINGKYVLNGEVAPILQLEKGETYIFDQSDVSNGSHPLRFSSTSDGTHNSGSEFTSGVTTNGTIGSAGAYTQIVVGADSPTLHYFCKTHPDMGSSITWVNFVEATSTIETFYGTSESDIFDFNSSSASAATVDTNTTRVFDSIYDFTSNQDVIRADEVGSVDFSANASASVKSVNVDGVTDFSALEIAIEDAITTQLVASDSNSAQIYDVTLTGSGLAASGINHLLIINDNDSDLSTNDIMIDFSGASSANILSSDLDFIA